MTTEELEEKMYSLLTPAEVRDFQLYLISPNRKEYEAVWDEWAKSLKYDTK